VKCLQKIVEGKYYFETIYLSKGRRLLFDKVGFRQGKQGDIVEIAGMFQVEAWWSSPTEGTIFKGSSWKQKDDKICFKPNSVIIRVCKYE